MNTGILRLYKKPEMYGYIVEQKDFLGNTNWFLVHECENIHNCKRLVNKRVTFKKHTKDNITKAYKLDEIVSKYD